MAAVSRAPALPSLDVASTSPDSRPLYSRRVTTGPVVHLDEMKRKLAAFTADASPPPAFPAELPPHSPAPFGSQSQGSSSPVSPDFRRASGEIPFAEEWRRLSTSGVGRPLGVDAGSRDDSGVFEAFDPAGDHNIEVLHDPLERSDAGPSDGARLAVEPTPPPDERERRSSSSSRPVSTSAGAQLLATPMRATPITPTPPATLVFDSATAFDFSSFADQLDRLAEERPPTDDPTDADASDSSPLINFADFSDSIAAILAVGDPAPVSTSTSSSDAQSVATTPRSSTLSPLDEATPHTFPFPSRNEPGRTLAVTPRASFDLIDFNSPATSARASRTYASHPASPISPSHPPSPPLKNHLSLEREPMVGQDGDDEEDDTRPSLELPGDDSAGEEEEDYDYESDEEEEEEEDPDSHPLYELLSTSSLAALRSTWDSATLILVPPRRTLPSLSALSPLPTAGAATLSPLASPPSNPGFEFVRGAKGVEGEVAGRDSQREREISRHLQEEYVGLHAFRPVPKDAERWRSVGTHEGGYVGVRMEPARGLVHVEPAGERRDLAVYRVPLFDLVQHTAPAHSLIDPDSLPPKPPTKAAFRAPKWLRRAPPSKTTPYTPPTKAKEPTPVLERVRVIAVDGQLVLDWIGAPGQTGRSHTQRSGAALGQSFGSGAGFGGSKSQLSLLQRHRSFGPREDAP
ncbi:hypothetical protein RQP46_008454 [Phenoliferia psychrophenolica]